MIFLIGHRGVGKTSFLSYLQSLPDFLGWSFFDLDREIETQTGQTVSEIFASKGEQHFRDLEIETLVKLRSQVPEKSVLALGAGFPIDRIANFGTFLWLRRRSDANLRFFIDRPRLDPNLEYEEEFHKRFSQRQDLFFKYSHVSLLLPEGPYFEAYDFSPWLRKAMNLKTPLLELPGWGVTWSPEVHKSPFDFDWYEFRSDLWNEDHFRDFMGSDRNKRILFSARSLNYREILQKSILPLRESISLWAIDFDSSLNLDQEALKNFREVFVSCHRPQVQEAIVEVSEKSNLNCKLKISPEVKSFEELDLGLRWQREDPLRRSFLPRGDQGEWSWVRLQKTQPLNFAREILGSASDQPPTQEVFNHRASKGFFAVLGDPIDHSYSPSFHRRFMSERGHSYYSIRIPRGGLKEALVVLKDLGLAGASVTSPLKTETLDLAPRFSNGFFAFNTISKTKSEGWDLENTDFPALRETLLSFLEVNYKNQKPGVVILGGGGILPSLRGAFSELEWSPREIALRDFESVAQGDLACDLVIWAGGDWKSWPRLLRRDTWLPLGKPTWIFDLSYTEASMGRFIAQVLGAKYFGGNFFFEAQARLQQKFWSEHGIE